MCFSQAFLYLLALTVPAQMCVFCLAIATNARQHRHRRWHLNLAQITIWTVVSLFSGLNGRCFPKQRSAPLWNVGDNCFFCSIWLIVLTCLDLFVDAVMSCVNWSLFSVNMSLCSQAQFVIYTERRRFLMPNHLRDWISSASSISFKPGPYVTGILSNFVSIVLKSLNAIL